MDTFGMGVFIIMMLVIIWFIGREMERSDSGSDWYHDGGHGKV
jgi:hypothetical protein